MTPYVPPQPCYTFLQLTHPVYFLGGLLNVVCKVFYWQPERAAGGANHRTLRVSQFSIVLTANPDFIDLPQLNFRTNIGGVWETHNNLVIHFIVTCNRILLSDISTMTCVFL